MKLRNIGLGNFPLVAGVVVDSIEKEKLRGAKKQGADLIEIRLDTFSRRDPRELKEKFRILDSFDLPLILTIRSKKEGGRFALSDCERLLLYNELIPFVDCVDIELGSKKIISRVIERAHANKKRVIVSYHNFKGTPRRGRLLDIIKMARNAGADVVKIAATAKDRDALKRLLGILLNKKRLIVIAMGRYGRESRVFFPLLGSLITYGAITRITAPGQFKIEELKRALSLFTA